VNLGPTSLGMRKNVRIVQKQWHIGQCKLKLERQKLGLHGEGKFENLASWKCMNMKFELGGNELIKQS